MVNQETIKDIAQSLKTTDTQKNNTHQAIVSHVDREGVVWVNVAGSEVETPTEAIASEVNPGDAVTVEWRNNKLYIAGNYSDPSAGMARTVIIQNVANQANDTAEMAIHDATIAHDAAISATESAATAGRAASVAQTAAEAAQATADTKKTVFITQPTPPYHVGDMWAKLGEDLQDIITSAGDNLVDSAGDLFQAAILTEGTIYVCTVPKLAGQTFAESDWELATADEGLREWFWHDADGAHVLGDETGFRNDITSTGMKIMDTSTETSVAEFGSNGAMVGKSGNTHIEMDYHSLKLVDKEGSPYLYISDLRDTDGNITVTAEASGTGTTYSIGFPISGVSKITINGVETTAYTYSDGVITFNTAPSEGSIIAFTCIPDSQYKDLYKAFTLGLRKNNNVTPFTYALGYKVNPSDVHAYAEGYLTEAGYMAHAEGCRTKAGYMAHAEGVYSEAQGDASHAGNYYTIAQGAMQTVIGHFNIAQGDPKIAHNSDHAFIIGNGRADDARSNALTVDWYGNLTLAGGLTVASPTETFSGTVGSGLSGSCNGIYDALSKTVRINFQVRKSTDISTSDVLFTIPSDYRPSAAVSGSGVVEAYVSSVYRTRAYEVTLDTSGQIKQGYSNYARSVFGVLEYSL